MYIIHRSQSLQFQVNQTDSSNMLPNYLRSSLCVFVLFVSFVSSHSSTNSEDHFSTNTTEKIMAPKVERITEIETTELGEGPHWDADTQSLYFVDIFGKSIHKYVPATKKHTKAIIGIVFFYFSNFLYSSTITNKKIYTTSALNF